MRSNIIREGGQEVARKDAVVKVGGLQLKNLQKIVKAVRSVVEREASDREKHDEVVMYGRRRLEGRERRRISCVRLLALVGGTL